MHIQRLIRFVTYTSLAVIAAIIIYWNVVTHVPPGNVGVVVNLIGDDRGVDQHELGVGLHLIAPWKDVYQFPTFEQNKTWQGDESFVFQTAEGLAVWAEAGITYHLVPNMIPILFQKYRRGMDEINDLFVRNHIRDAINRTGSHLTVEELYGSSKDTFFDRVQQIVADDLAPIGIVISRIYLIGRLHFPDNVVNALNSKIEATQRAQQRENELREAEAQAKKEIAASEGRGQSLLIEAKAKAEANHILSKSITRELINYQAVQKWDGVLPKVTGETVPLIDLGTK